MEVTKQKMRCAAAEDPSYPCKHHGEEQVSQLPGEEVTAACWGVSSPRCHRGKSQMEPDMGSHGQVRGQKVGPPGQQLPQVWEGRPASWAVRVAGPLLTITMSLCAGTAVANRAEKRPLPSARGERGGGPPGSTQLHVYLYPNGHPAHAPMGGSLFPKDHHPGDLSLGACPSLACLCSPKGPALTLGTLSVPKGAALERASAPQGGKPRAHTVLGLTSANTEGRRTAPRDLADQ